MYDNIKNGMTEEQLKTIKVLVFRALQLLQMNNEGTTPLATSTPDIHPQQDLKNVLSIMSDIAPHYKTVE